MLTIYEKKEFKPAQTANVLDTTEIVPVQFTTIMGNKKPIERWCFELGMRTVSDKHLTRSHNRGRRPQGHAISSIGAVPMIKNNFSIFSANWHTRLYTARIFADVTQRKWRPNFPKSFMLLAHNSTRVCLLEFCLSIFFVSCSSLSEVRQCRI